MTLAQQITKLIEEHTKAQASEIVTLKSKVSKLTRQRDEARGRANEYRSYAAKYQKELAAIRKEMR
jgi:peptidoglycan hydrolase CwlO-like protein